MLKFLLFLTLLTFVAASCPKKFPKCGHDKAAKISKCLGKKTGCKGSKKEVEIIPPDYGKYGDDQPENLVDDLSRDLKRIDDYLRETCNNNGNSETRVVFGPERYSLYIPLVGVTINNIVVKTKYRFVYIHAKRTNGGQDYTEIRRLSKLVDVTQGYWIFNGYQLILRFKYVNYDSNTPFYCGTDYSDTLTTIHRSIVDYVPDYNVDYIQNGPAFSPAGPSTDTLPEQELQHGPVPSAPLSAPVPSGPLAAPVPSGPLSAPIPLGAPVPVNATSESEPQQETTETQETIVQEETIQEATTEQQEPAVEKEVTVEKEAEDKTETAAPQEATPSDENTALNEVDTE